MSSTLPAAPRPRVLSIDVLRGLTIFLMILVNDPGDPQQVFAPLEHAPWNGYTAADLVFPNFLFLSGMSLVFSLQSRLQRGDARGPIARSLFRRAFNLLLLKLFIAALPTFRVRRIRIFGVLFRTALCSLLGGLILLTTLSIPALLSLTAAILAAYYGALRIPFGSLNQPLLDPDNNLAAHLDRKIAHLFHGELHTGALYNVTHDPEGLLSSAPALATVLLGAVAAITLRNPSLSPEAKRNTFAAAGLASLAVGHLWHRTFPINKNLWTSSYVLASAGWSSLALAALYTLLDLKPRPSRTLRALILPAQIFGTNALVAYAVSVAGHKIARTTHLHSDGHSLSLRTWAYRKTLARTRSTPARSLAFAATYACLCILPNLFLHRGKIFVKI